MGYIGSDPKTNESVSTAQLVDDSVTNAKIVDNVLFTSVTSSVVSASNTIIADTFTGTFSGALSSSAQISSDISGSFTAVSSSFSSRTTTLESASGSDSTRITTLEGRVNQGVKTTDSPTFAGATVTGTLTANEIHTTFVSSSVATITGSNVFGDAVGDLHSFTGSVSISGSQTSLVTAGNVDFNGNLDVGGTTNLDNTDIDGTLTVDGGNIVFNEDSADQDFRVESNGQTHMLFVDGGNNRVGIGISNPSYPLVVSDGGGLGFEFSPDHGGGGYNMLQNYNRAGSAYVPIYHVATDHRFFNGGTETLTISGSGHVIVPQGTLEVGQHGVAGGQIVSDGDLSIHSGFNDSSTGNGDIIFKRFGEITSAVELARVTSTGRLGIGTSSPDAKLKVEESTNGANVEIKMRALTDGGGGRTFSFTADPDARTLAMGESGELLIKEGNVGIGTTNPGAILDVDSGATGESDSEACGIRVTLQRNGSAQGLTLRHEDASGGSTDASEGTSIQFQGYDGSNSYHNLAAIFGRADGESVSDSDSPGFLTFHTTPNGSDSFQERMRIDSSGNVGIGGTPSDKLDIHGGNLRIRVGGLGAIYLQNDGSNNSDIFANDNTGTTKVALRTASTSYITGGYVGIGTTNPEGTFHVHSPNGADDAGYTMTVKNMDETANQGNTLYVYGGNNSVQDAVLRVDTRTQGTALACIGTGAVGVGLTGPNVPFHVRKAGNGKAGNIARFAQENDSDSVLMYGRGSGAYGASSADACMAVATMETTGRSINAGGTINASGADYAEYETKRTDCGTIEKGDIVGFDTNGLITDKWTNAVTFGIKSTNPSYVGGDTWGVGVSSGSIETERQKVDRIAYSGKVPCNVTGSNVGDYIIPIQVGDGIGGVAKSNPTYDEYRQSIGVVRTFADGSPIVVVKTL